MAFSKSFADSSVKKRQAVEEWVYNNIDYGQIRQGFPLCFYRNTSFYLMALPNLRTYPEDFQQKVVDAIIDRDMLEDMQGSGLINWCHTVSQVVPIRVPKDGNCLLHAIAVAVWGIMDGSLILRRLLSVALINDGSGRFHSRWAQHRQDQISHLVGKMLDSGSQSLDKEWQEVRGSLDPDRPASVAVPHRFLESIHVYTLANILRRPLIILTDPTVRAFSGLSLQDNDMGGIYLPLEWDWNDTNKTPVLLAYAQNHFCPLLFVDHSHSCSSQGSSRKNLAPIVTDKLEQLPVRFLLKGEEPEVSELLKKYLKVKETVMTLEGTIHAILCAEFETSSLPDDLNLVAEYFRDCEHQYRFQRSSLTGSACFGLQSAGVQQMEVPHHQGLSAGLVYEHLQQAGNHNQSAGSPQHGRRRVQPLHLPTRHISVPLDIPPPNLLPSQRYYQEQGQDVSLSPPPGRKCIVPLCKFYGDVALGMMCSNCFKDYTILESKRTAAARAYERQQPTAPLASIGAGESQECYMSMMPERCQKGCGYRASRHTRPFCHECYEKLQTKDQDKVRSQEQPEASGAAAAGSSAVPAETTSASATAGLLPADSTPSAVAQASGFAMRNPILDPCVPSTPPVTSHPGSNARQQQDLIRFSRISGTLKPEAAVTSPTQVLNNISMTAPLTPPDDTSDKDLFGYAGSSPTTSGQPAVTTSTSNPAAATKQHPTDVNKTNTTFNNLSRQDRTFPSTPRQCVTEGCFGEVVQHDRCSKCYIGIGLILNKTTEKMMKTNPEPGALSQSNDPRDSFTQGEEMGNPRPQNGCIASSMPRPPNMERPLNTSLNYVSNWLNSSEQPVGNKVAEAGNENLGLPEKSSDELGEGDLVPSGEACHASGIKCVSPFCQNQVAQPGQLCQSCQDVLRSACPKQESGPSQAQGPSQTSVQGLPGVRQKCLVEGCNFFGAQQTHLYCSDHYHKAFKTQLAEETRRNHPANVSHTVPLSHSQMIINMTPELRPLTMPQFRRGSKCIRDGCTFFGDPKQKDLCGKHYQEYISSIASGSNVRVLSPGIITGPSYVAIGPQYVPLHQTASIQPPSPRIMATGKMSGTANYLHGAVSVPPPSFPVAESCSEESMLEHPVIGGSHSLDETYTRVTTKNVKRCLVDGCQNYGNSSRGGLCNSCFENKELVRQVILGEEECG